MRAETSHWFLIKTVYNPPPLSPRPHPRTAAPSYYSISYRYFWCKVCITKKLLLIFANDIFTVFYCVSSISLWKISFCTMQYTSLMNKLHISNNKAILTQEHATTWPYSRRSMQHCGHTHAGACKNVATLTQEHAIAWPHSRGSMLIKVNF